MSQTYKVIFRAEGEVRDKDGNLLSSTPVEFEHEVPEAHLRALGATDADIAAINRGDMA